MNKHSVDDLKQMQALPLESKIAMTKRRIREWYEHWDGQVYVSFSGGKDSTVLKHIVDSMYSDVPAVFVNTGLEYPEIQRFATAQRNVVSVRPEMRFDRVVRRYGYPIIGKEVSERIYYAKKGANWAVQCMNGNNPDGTKSDFKRKTAKWAYVVDAPFKVSHKCCAVMKKKPAKQYEKETGRKPIIGTMACESHLRKAQWEKIGCNGFEGERPRSAPLSFWTEQDILHYIRQYNVPYCPIYGEIRIKQRDGEAEGQMNLIDYLGCYEPEDILETTGCDRTGCMFCAFGCHLEREPNRFQRMRVTHPKQYAYCIGGGEYVDGIWQPSKEGLGMGKVLDYIHVKY